jgi:hypothetical protein
MKTMDVLILSGFLLFAVSCWALYYVYRPRAQVMVPRHWMWVATLSGVCLGCLTFALKISPAPTLQVQGVPLPVVIFELDEQDGRWRDYVGWTTVVFGVADFVIGFGIPHMLLAIASFIRKRSA